LLNLWNKENSVDSPDFVSDCSGGAFCCGLPDAGFALMQTESSMASRALCDKRNCEEMTSVMQLASQKFTPQFNESACWASNVGTLNVY
jgi:hypothetical protein